VIVLAEERAQSGPDEAVLEPGDAVDQYRVVRMIGRGGMGAVYLARDNQLGRKVALKVVHLRRQRTAGDRQQAIDAFLAEARITARFNHPHIVTVYGVGRHGDHPYVALEYLEGQSLRQRLREERPGLKEAARIGQAIAEALAEAHRHKILHRDLKPENVILPRDGRLRVVDFGLATAQVTEHEKPDARAEPTSPEQQGASLSGDSISLSQTRARVVGTPRYIAPEIWKRGDPSPASDVWALGMILYELFSGRHPYRALSRVEIYRTVRSDEPIPPLPGTDVFPTELIETVSRCLEKDPQRRTSAARVAGTLRQFLSKTRQPLTQEINPFRGLLPFGERDADMFFGRDEEIGAFLERLRVTPVLPVVGPSGAGKSSFVQAGVLPRLRDLGQWAVVQLRPGLAPFQTLAERLSSAGGHLDESTTTGAPVDLESEVEAMEKLVESTDDDAEVETLERQLSESPGRLSLVLQQIAEDQQCRVLLIVDQLEELYTLVDADDVRRRFMQAICTAADDPQGPVRVLFTLRDDYLVRLAETAEAREALSQVTMLRTPGPEALEEILTRPLERVGYRYQPVELQQQISDAVHGEVAGLPVLQFTLSQLWARRDRERRVLSGEAYDEMGGLEGALASHADSILERVTPAQVRLARRIFLRLVTPQGSRRIVTRERLLEGLDQSSADVLDILTRERVVLARRAHGDRDAEAELELVHESLVTSWHQLAKWVDESREEISFLAEIGQAAELWEKRGRSNHEVWRGPTLQEAEVKITRCAVVPEQVQAFMKASQRLARRRVRRRRIAVATVMVALAVVGIVFAVKEREVRQQHAVAEAQRERAETQRAEALRGGALAALARTDMLEARAKLRLSLETRDSTLARVLWWRLRDDPLRWRHRFPAVVYQAIFSPDGETVAAAGMDKSIYLVDAETKKMQILRGHGDQILTIDYSPDGERLAAGTWGGSIWIWDLKNLMPNKLEGHTARVRDLAFAPDGELIASCGFDKMVRLWDGTTGESRGVLHTADTCIMGVDFSPDGSQLAVAGCDHKLRLFDVNSRQEVRVFEGHADRIFDVSFNRDGESIVSASTDTTIRIWSTASGEQLHVLPGDKVGVAAVEVSPNGDLIASGGKDSTIRLWNLETGELVRELHGHTSSVRGLGFSPDGTRLASSSYDATVHLWDLTIPATRSRRVDEASPIYGIDVSPDDRRVAAGSRDGLVRIMSVDSGAEQAVLRDHTSSVYAVAFSPDGSVLATGGKGTNIVLTNAETGVRIGKLVGHTSTVYRAVFTPRGERLITASADETIRVWDVATATQRAVLQGHTNDVYDVALASDGKTLVSGSIDRTVRLWNPETGEQLRTFEGHEAEVWGVAFSPDGRRVYSSSSDKTVRVWDVESGEGRVIARHGSRVYKVEPHPDGRRVASCSADGTARITDTLTDESIALDGHLGEVNVLRIAGDGAKVATGSDDGTVRIWEADTGRGWWRAPALIGDPPRLITHQGWIDVASSSPAETGDSAWRRAIDERTVGAAAASTASLVCIATDSGLQLWDTDEDELVRELDLPQIERVLALPGGCLVLAEGEAVMLGAAGAPRELATEVTAVDLVGDRPHLAAGKHVLVLDPSGERLATHPVSADATALSRVGDWLVLGYEDGAIELAPLDSSASRPRFPFEEIPSSPVVRLTEGPMGTVVAGFADGLWGIWDPNNGALLYRAQLHGPVVHLLLKKGKLYAASELGQYAVLDVSMFDRDYCDLLREVWDRVTVTWAGGLPVLGEPPRDHPCRNPVRPRD
jgi:WD40 repeat protein/serine/threonine protein kinase